jgi:hypothetical protein
LFDGDRPRFEQPPKVGGEVLDCRVQGCRVAAVDDITKLTVELRIDPRRRRIEEPSEIGVRPELPRFDEGRSRPPPREVGGVAPDGRQCSQFIE